MARMTPKQFKSQARSLANSFHSTITEAIMESAIVAEQHFDDSFENEGFKDNGKVKKWKPNSPETIRRKGHNTVLKGKTGKLRKSQKRTLFQAQGRQGARITYGERYAAWMNDGFTNLSGIKVPSRKFIGISGSLNRKVSKAILGKMRKHFTTKYYIGK